MASTTNFDAIISQLGEFGKYQRRMLLLVFCMSLPCSMHAFVQVFLAAYTDHWCTLSPNVQKNNCSKWTLPTATNCEEAKKEVFIPKTKSGSFEQCLRYNVSLGDFESYGMYGDDKDGLIATDSVNYTAGTIPCDHGWMYDHSEYESTIVQSVRSKIISHLSFQLFVLHLVKGS